MKREGNKYIRGKEERRNKENNKKGRKKGGNKGKKWERSLEGIENGSRKVEKKKGQTGGGRM